MSDFATDESHPVFPVFLLIDVSYSMDGEPMRAVNEALPEVKRAVSDDPTVGEIARLGIMTFSDVARSVLPLCDLAYADVPVLGPEGGTNFASAFRLAHAEIEAGVRSLGKGTRFHRPVLFFISDGFHTADEDWTNPLRDLTDKTGKFAPEIVTFGFGEANATELGKIATRYAFLAAQGPPAGQVKEVMAALVGSIKTTSGSIRSGEGGLIVQPDPTKFTPLPVQTV